MVIELASTADQMSEVVDVFGEVWGSSVPVVTVELLVAVAHGGGYVSVARPDHGGGAVGASFGFLARHDPGDGRVRPALHSHVTGLVPSVRGTGLGRALKLHQRQWAQQNGIEWIVWTFDPLVRRNAWFNLAVLGADVCEYAPGFYGEMSDDINSGDDSDRLVVAWEVERPLPDSSLDPGAAAGPIDLVPTPEDIVELRRTDPAAVLRWRVATRVALTEALDTGRPIIGFTRAGEYVIGSAT
jgi:predicted GNAT superfamily acetyltransferase